MQLLSIIYFSYMFISLYFLFFFLIIYLRNKKEIFDCPAAKRKYNVSIIVPCYNEEKHISGTIESILKCSYLGFKKLIVVDDCSKDGSWEVIREWAKRDKRVVAVQTPKNTGCAAGAKNYGLKYADTEVVGFSDADSFPEPDAIGKCLGFFNDEKVAGVTCSILVKRKEKFIEKLQAFEYATIAWTRKLLGYVEGIWAMPGPLALYRKEILKKIGGFDEKNLTEDIEITWRIISRGYKVEMCLPARVYSIAPIKIMTWIKQRMRWDIGGIQCMNKYKGHFLSKLGYFIIPFFALSMSLGLVGLGVFFYITLRGVMLTYFYTNYSFAAGTSLIDMNQVYVSSSILNLFGVTLFFLGAVFVIFGLGVMQENRRNIFNLLFYMVIYLTLYPAILLFAILKMIGYKIIGKKLGWGTR